MSDILNERAQTLLKVLIERYIRDGQPVGSKTLAEDSSLAISSATIRNIMAELEDRGFIHSPHTSAGRVPTELGYRFFVDSLLTVRHLDDLAIQQLQQQLSTPASTQGLVSSASALLSGLSQMAGLVTIPKREHFHLRHVEFLPLSERRILVVLVLNESEVQNRIIYTQRDYSQQELQLAAQYINAKFAGKDVYHIRQSLLAALHEDRQSMDTLLSTTMEVVDQAFSQDQATDDYVLAGQSHLFDLAQETSFDKLRQLFDAFSEKRRILHLLDQAIQAEGVQIYIGGESGLDILNDCSVITAPYSANNKIVGVLGVLGPTRMAYDKVIPIVDITAKLLSAALNKSN